MYKPTYISTATTTAVSTTPCVLHSVVIGETAAGAITIKDGETTIAVLKSSIAEGKYQFDAIIRESLSIVTAAASKLTVLTKPATV
jgi:hypothetical protein